MTTAVVPVRNQPIRRTEREFLPAALEIVETPPSPIGRLGAYCLVAVFALALVWAWFGRVDIVAVAKGKIIPTGHTKIVQPFEIGVVRAILVHDGQKVKVGDVLIELDPTMNQADLDHQRNDLMAAKIDIARLTAALKGENDPDARFVAPEGASLEQARMGEQFLIGQMSQYRSKLASLAGEEAQKRAEQESQKVSIGKIETLLPILEERAQMRKTLFDHQTGSKLAYLEDLQDLLSHQKDLEVQTSHLKEAEAGVAASKAKQEETRAEFHRQVLNDLAEATRKANGLAQDVAKSEQRTKFQALTAPIDGTVQQLAVHSVGGVVTPAQTLLTIVPADSTMEIEAMVDNQDIGFVPSISPATACCTARSSRCRRTPFHARVPANPTRRSRAVTTIAPRRSPPMPPACRSARPRCRSTTNWSICRPAWPSPSRSGPASGGSSTICSRRSCATPRRACASGDFCGMSARK